MTEMLAILARYILFPLPKMFHGHGILLSLCVLQRNHQLDLRIWRSQKISILGDCNPQVLVYQFCST